MKVNQFVVSIGICLFLVLYSMHSSNNASLVVMAHPTLGPDGLGQPESGANPALSKQSQQQAGDGDTANAASYMHAAPDSFSSMSPDISSLNAIVDNEPRYTNMQYDTSPSEISEDEFIDALDEFDYDGTSTADFLLDPQNKDESGLSEMLEALHISTQSSSRTDGEVSETANQQNLQTTSTPAEKIADSVDGISTSHVSSPKKLSKIIKAPSFKRSKESIEDSTVKPEMHGKTSCNENCGQPFINSEEPHNISQLKNALNKSLSAIAIAISPETFNAVRIPFIDDDITNQYVNVRSPSHSHHHVEPSFSGATVTTPGSSHSSGTALSPKLNYRDLDESIAKTYAAPDVQAPSNLEHTAKSDVSTTAGLSDESSSVATTVHRGGSESENQALSFNLENSLQNLNRLIFKDKTALATDVAGPKVSEETRNETNKESAATKNNKGANLSEGDSGSAGDSQEGLYVSRKIQIRRTIADLLQKKAMDRELSKNSTRTKLTGDADSFVAVMKKQIEEARKIASEGTENLSNVRTVKEKMSLDDGKDDFKKKLNEQISKRLNKIASHSADVSQLNKKSRDNNYDAGESSSTPVAQNDVGTINNKASSSKNDESKLNLRNAKNVLGNFLTNKLKGNKGLEMHLRSQIQKEEDDERPVESRRRRTAFEMYQDSVLDAQERKDVKGSNLFLTGEKEEDNNPVVTFNVSQKQNDQIREMLMEIQEALKKRQPNSEE